MTDDDRCVMLRAGYHSVTPRIVVADVEAQVAFLRARVRRHRATSSPARPAEIRIGDSLVMVTPAVERELFPRSCTCTSTTPTSGTSGRWLAGASSIEAPLDTPYGDRRAMVRDPFGNIFQIARGLTCGTRSARRRAARR